ncbi:PEP-CTERM sorting domain-containing protein [Methylophilus sp. 5]|uniref:PEP-CTERM sorting domain-containing protein n=1 Tax=Methylophilus sp. 5 TaxID=1112274 RepID=UPI00048B7653|nr:PEP-CTERM sorting domain-containing protein [Methylophilus sp. 5]
MKQFSKFAVAMAMAVGCTQAFAAASIFVTEPGADGFNIQTVAFNGSSYDITKIVFDFSSTLTGDGSHVVIDGSPFSVSAPAGGTATFFGSGAVFGFDFTSFNSFDVFTFKWDPDSAISGAYGATGLDFIGGTVTAFTTSGLYKGTFELVGNGPDVSAQLSPYVPVPEPLTSASLLAGLGVLGLAGRRRRS